jgi:hypothetical protein
MARGHAAIDCSARNCAANRSGRCAEKPVAKQAVTHDGAGNSADDRSSGR